MATQLSRYQRAHRPRIEGSGQMTIQQEGPGCSSAFGPMMRKFYHNSDFILPPTGIEGTSQTGACLTITATLDMSSATPPHRHACSEWHDRSSRISAPFETTANDTSSAP